VLGADALGEFYFGAPGHPKSGLADSGETIRLAVSQLIEDCLGQLRTRIRLSGSIGCGSRCRRSMQLREPGQPPRQRGAIVARRFDERFAVWQWSSPGDSTRPRIVCPNYGSHSVLERRKRSSRLGELPQAYAFEPLLRLPVSEAERCSPGPRDPLIRLMCNTK